MSRCTRILSAAVIAVVLAASLVHADVVTDWNITAIKVTQLAAGFSGGSFTQTRTLAHTHAAIFDTVNAIDRKYQPYAIDLKAPAGASVEAAVATAAHTVLVAEVPLQ